MSRVELYERIRRDSRLEGLSIRALAARHHVHRRTVREALASAVPAGRRGPVRGGPAVGTLCDLSMFCMRLSCSGRGFDVAFANEAQEAFLEGHVEAFKRFSGVPARIRYDNLKLAVIRVMLGRRRLENPRFVGLRSHYGF